MSSDSENPDLSSPLATPDVESLLAAVSAQEAATAVANSGATPARDEVQAYDFRNPTLLSPREMRKLRAHQEVFVQDLASQLSSHLRVEFALSLTALQTIPYTKLAQSWNTPTHLTLFKLDPLRGISILEIQSELGLSMVDRLLGGSGQNPEASREMSEIERALFDQTAQMILEDWSGHWSKVKELKPVILAYENNGRFIQTFPSETSMLVLTMAASYGECTGQIQIGFPFTTVESLVKSLSQGELSLEATTSVPAATPGKNPQTPAAPFKWNACFDDVCVPVIAEWQGLELTARAMLALKVGDVVPMNPQCAQEVKVLLADTPKFQGRPGTIAGQWAVELTSKTEL